LGRPKNFVVFTGDNFRGARDRAVHANCQGSWCNQAAEVWFVARARLVLVWSSTTYGLSAQFRLSNPPPIAGRSPVATLI
jgi:hypothetical protein